MTTLFVMAMRIWNRFWFTPDAGRNLAAARILVAAHSFWIILSRDYAAISGLQEFWVTVPLSRQWRFLLFPGHAAIEGVLQTVLIVTLFTALLGIMPRLSCFLAGLLIYHLAPLETIMWGAVPYGRGLTLAPIALLVLAFSRCGDALVVTKSQRAQDSVLSSWQYGWPLRVIQLFVAQIYLFSAYGKLVTTGLSWSSGENIRRWFLLFNVDPTQGRFHALGLWIVDHPFLSLAIGVGTVLFEWAFIFAVFDRRARWILVPMALTFHIAVIVGMNVHVGETWLVLVFINWDWLLTRLRIGRASVKFEPAIVPA
jgi:hypothetical protein